MYSVDLKNVAPSGGVTCLFAKATLDEYNLWHRRLGHINFKTLNKLVRGNLVSGLPSKIFKNNQTCVACQKGKQHKASYPLGKFDGKADEGFFVGYAVNSKAFRGINLIVVQVKLEWRKEEEKKDAEDPGNEGNEVLSTKEPRVNQEKDANVNSTNNINTVSLTDNVAGIKDNAVDENIVFGCADDLNMPNLEEIVYLDDDEDVGKEANITNLDTNIPVSPIPTTRIHKDHPVEQIIRDIHSRPQTRRMTKNVTNHGMFSSVQQRINHKDFQNYLFDCFLLEVEPKKQVWTLVDLPNGKREIETKWIYKNKKDEKGILVRNKGRLVAQGYNQEEGINYDEVFAVVARIEAIRLFLAYASFKDFVVYQIDVKSAFLYGKVKEEIDKTLFIKRVKGDILLVQVYVDDIIFESTRKEMCIEFEKMMHKKCQMSSIGELTIFLGLQVTRKDDGIFLSQDKYVHEILKKFGFSTVKTSSTSMDVDVYLYRSMIGSLMYLPSSRPDIMFDDSPFDLEAYTENDYDGASFDRKSTAGGFQFLGRRLISWQCKKKTVVANSTTEAEDSYKKRLIQVIKIHTDHNVADLLTKEFDVSRFHYLIASIGMLNL
nr:hypothetical protein [Tanacetum cinerariifolium]